MNCLVLAAGLGTRLRPLTDTIPKALVPLRGKALLAILLDKLFRSGCDHVVINTHHLAKQIELFLQQPPYAGMRITLSHEEEILDSGGGVKQMVMLLPSQDPVLVHNVDVVSDLDFSRLLTAHENRNAEVTLAVMNRPTKRYLVFDHNYALIDREKTGQELFPAAQRLAFNGIQVVNPGLFDNAPSGPFSCIEYYIELARHHHPVFGFDMTGSYWRDLGRLPDLQQAEADIENGRLAL